MDVVIPTRNLIFLTAQTATICSFLVWIWFIGIKLHRQKYGYYYIFVRLLFYKDTVPLKWLKAHKLYIFYAIQIFSLLCINTALILQIRDGTLYKKPWILLVGDFFLAVSSVFVMQYLTRVVVFLENRNFDEHLIELQKKIRRLKHTKDNKKNGTA